MFSHRKSRGINSTYYFDDGIFGDNAEITSPGGSGGGNGQEFSLFATVATKRDITPDLQAGQTIKITVLQDYGSWLLSLLDPNGDPVQRLYSTAAPKIIQATVTIAGTYEMFFKTQSSSGQVAGVVGVYEII